MKHDKKELIVQESEIQEEARIVAKTIRAIDHRYRGDFLSLVAGDVYKENIQLGKLLLKAAKKYGVCREDASTKR